jgi:hypothetical protein
MQRLPPQQARHHHGEQRHQQRKRTRARLHRPASTTPAQRSAARTPSFHGFTTTIIIFYLHPTTWPASWRRALHSGARIQDPGRPGGPHHDLFVTPGR